MSYPSPIAVVPFPHAIGALYAAALRDLRVADEETRRGFFHGADALPSTAPASGPGLVYRAAGAAAGALLFGVPRVPRDFETDALRDVIRRLERSRDPDPWLLDWRNEDHVAACERARRERVREWLREIGRSEEPRPFE